MQDNSEAKQELGPKLLDLTPDDKRNFVGAFAWLLAQDKKQNPARYKLKTEQNDWYSMSFGPER